MEFQVTLAVLALPVQCCDFYLLETITRFMVISRSMCYELTVIASSALHGRGSRPGRSTVPYQLMQAVTGRGFLRKRMRTVVVLLLGGKLGRDLSLRPLWRRSAVGGADGWKRIRSRRRRTYISNSISDETLVLQVQKGIHTVGSCSP